MYIGQDRLTGPKALTSRQLQTTNPFYTRSFSESNIYARLCVAPVLFQYSPLTNEINFVHLAQQQQLQLLTPQLKFEPITFQNLIRCNTYYAIVVGIFNFSLIFFFLVPDYFKINCPAPYCLISHRIAIYHISKLSSILLNLQNLMNYLNFYVAILLQN